MAIKDKDGNVFKLSGPNPVMKTQELWDLKNIIYHNMKFGEIIAEGEREPEINVVLHKLSDQPTTQEVLARAEPQPIPVEEEPVSVAVMEPVKPSVTQKTAQLLQKNKVIFYCLPVLIQKYSDDLYGGEYTKDIYGDKFAFPAIVIEETDLVIQFWADTKLPERSVVYPKMRTKRWWRIQESSEKSGGHLYSAVASDVNPDFGD